MKVEGDDKKVMAKNDKKFECVFVKQGDKAKLRVIKTGIQDDTNIEVVTGLKKGAQSHHRLQALGQCSRIADRELFNALQPRQIRCRNHRSQSQIGRASCRERV